MSRAPRALRPSPALKLELLRYTLWRQRDIPPHRSRTWHTCPASRLSRYSSSNRTTSEYGASRHFSAALEGLTILFFKHASYITPKEPRLLRLWRSGQQLHMMTRGLGGICRAGKAGADSAYDTANMETSIHPRVAVYYNDGCSILGWTGLRFSTAIAGFISDTLRKRSRIVCTLYSMLKKNARSANGTVPHKERRTITLTY
jgi:hypothetical protein